MNATIVPASTPDTTAPPWRDSLRVALAPWLVARVVVVTAVFIGLAIERSRHGLDLSFWDHGLLSWDAAYYRDIADHGYAGVEDAGVRFFPLLPLIARVVGFGHGAFGVVLVANVTAYAVAVLVHRLVVIEASDTALAARTVWLTMCFPSAFVLVFGYAESLLMLAAVVTFLAIRSRRWWVAAIAGFAAGLTRPTGVLLSLPAAIEAWRRRDDWERSRARLIGVIAAVAAPVVGLGAFLVWAATAYGDALRPMRMFSSPELRGGWIDPIRSIVGGFGDLLSGDRVGSGLHAVWAVMFIALIVVMARRLPVSYTAWTAATIVLALSADNLDSFERYALVAFPLAWTIATGCTRRWNTIGVITASAALMASYTVLAVTGTAIP